MIFISGVYPARKCSCFGAVCLFLLVAILFHPVFVFPAESKEEKKKQRFELTETTLRDWKTKLEWYRYRDSSPGSLSWYKAMDYVMMMNARRHGGLRDWRLPTQEELLSLVEYARQTGFDGTPGREVSRGLQQAGLSFIQNEHYWSATNDLFNDRFAWAVDLQTGNPESIGKHLYENVVIVRTLK